MVNELRAHFATNEFEEGAGGTAGHALAASVRLIGTIAHHTSHIDVDPWCVLWNELTKECGCRAGTSGTGL